jgi:hypothetical protein
MPKLTRNQRRLIAAIIGLILGWLAASWAQSRGWLWP